MSRLALSLLVLPGLAGCLAGCEEKKDKPTTTTSAAQTKQPTTNAAPTTEKKAESTTEKSPVQTWKGLSTPESVLYDDGADAYLVSNINGKPGDVDGNGFISRLAPDGKITELKWIESGKNKATLNAPKGMALVGESLYVADIDTVRIFDRKTGAPGGEVKIPGASFLNDVAGAGDGRVLVSDTGVDGKDFSSKGTDALWAIDVKTKKATPLVKAKELEGPNGILVQGEKIWVVTFGGAAMYQVDGKNGKKGDSKKMPKGKLDGIVAAGDEVLVSSWESSTVYRGKPDGTFAPFVENVEAPADIGFDTKRSRLLVPLFNGNEVRAYDVAAPSAQGK